MAEKLNMVAPVLGVAPYGARDALDALGRTSPSQGVSQLRLLRLLATLIGRRRFAARVWVVRRGGDSPRQPAAHS